MKKFVTYLAVIFSVFAVGLPQQAHANSRASIQEEGCKATTKEGRNILFSRNSSQLSAFLRGKIKKGKRLTFHDVKKLLEAKVSDRDIRAYARKTKTSINLTVNNKAKLKKLGASQDTIKAIEAKIKKKK